MALKKVLDVKSLNRLITEGIINKEGVRLFDCSYAIGAKPDWQKFKAERFAHFEQQHEASSVSRNLYLSGHIPLASFLSLDAALYPSEFERFAMYEPGLFQEYGQYLGIDKGEHLIFYSRGELGGMMFATKAAWMFKSYGHEDYSIVDGGLAQWKHAGLPLDHEDVKLPKGNWEAKDEITHFNVDFEELYNVVSEDKKLIEMTDSYNFLDARVRGQFNGTEETGFGSNVAGSHIKGYKNAPASELLKEDGTLKDNEHIRNFLDSVGFDPSQPIITNCNTGMQGSMLAFAIEDVIDHPPRVYNGSLKEIELRDPKRISEGPRK